MRLQIEVPPGDVELWITIAYRFGYKRIEPRKAWTDAERKEAIRYAINYAAESFRRS